MVKTSQKQTPVDTMARYMEIQPPTREHRSSSIIAAYSLVGSSSITQADLARVRSRTTFGNEAREEGREDVTNGKPKTQTVMPIGGAVIPIIQHLDADRDTSRQESDLDKPPLSSLSERELRAKLGSSIKGKLSAWRARAMENVQETSRQRLKYIESICNKKRMSQMIDMDSMGKAEVAVDNLRIMSMPLKKKSKVVKIKEEDRETVDSSIRKYTR